MSVKPRWVMVSLGIVAVAAVAAIWLSSGSPPRPPETTPPSSAELAEQLKALPYAGWRPVSQDGSLAEGVVHHDRQRAFAGANLYSLTSESSARLIDMEGAVLHQWENDRSDWHHVEMDGQGHLFVVGEEALVKMGWDSNLLWETPGTFHHDLAIGPEGTLYSLMRKPKYVTQGETVIPILDDLIVVMSPEGAIRDSISLWSLFAAQVKSSRLEHLERLVKSGRGLDDGLVRETCDVFHANSIEVLDRDLDGIARSGDLLISVREIDTVAIVSPDGGRVLWSWGEGQLVRPHHPSVLDNGNILLFDNRTQEEGSRVIEVNPQTREIEWDYHTADPKDFCSVRRGSCQRLPNGNTLITESDQGRVLEVSATGDIVWEFRSEVRNVRIRKRAVERAAVYRMVRFSRSVLGNLPLDDTVLRRLDGGAAG